jgi:O-antigen/teichoic acid export membrane protein
MHFPYALQLAFGNSRLPLVINSTLLVIFVPLLIVLSVKFGIVGAAAAWAILNLLYLFLGTWLTHQELLPGIGWRWLGGDVGVPLFASLILVGGGCLAVRTLDLPAPAAMLIGLALAGLAFFAIFALTPGMGEFARRTFEFRPPLPDAKA